MHNTGQTGQSQAFAKGESGSCERKRQYEIIATELEVFLVAERPEREIFNDLASSDDGDRGHETIKVEGQWGTNEVHDELRCVG